MSEHHSNLWDTSENGGLPGAGGLDTSALPTLVDHRLYQKQRRAA
jgi:hypothetical protein